MSRDKPKPHKLHPIYLGPFSVLSHVKNDVELRHLSTGVLSTAYIEDLTAFFGTLEDAKRLAALDADQFTISSLKAYRGDPLLRSSMSFLVLFEDGDELWLPWSTDLSNAVPFDTYCRTRNELAPLLLSAELSKQWLQELKREPITSVNPSTSVLTDLRAFGADWYASLHLPNADTLTYVISAKYGPLSVNKRSIQLKVPMLDYETQE